MAIFTLQERMNQMSILKREITKLTNSSKKDREKAEILKKVEFHPNTNSREARKTIDSLEKSIDKKLGKADSLAAKLKNLQDKEVIKSEKK